MSREFTSGNSFNVYIWNMPIHVESASLAITDNTAMVTTHGVPDGYGLARASQPFALPIF